MGATLGVSAAVLASSGESLALTVSGATNPLSPTSGITGFSVKADGVTQTISGVTSATNVATIALSAPIRTGQVVTFSYTPGNLVDSTGTPNTMPAIVNQAVTNNSTEVYLAAPSIGFTVVDQIAKVISWGAVVGASQYKIYKNGVYLATVTGVTTYTDTIAKGKTASYRITSVDAEGLEGSVKSSSFGRAGTVNNYTPVVNDVTNFYTSNGVLVDPFGNAV